MTAKQNGDASKRRSWHGPGATVAALALAASISQGQGRTLPNGDQVRFDGTYYDYRAADARAMIKVWVPPEARPVRGLFISGHGGGGGDSRNFTRDGNMKALAARFGFGLVGLHSMPGRQIYSAEPIPGGKRFFDALNAFASFGVHPELKHVPFVVFGSSNGGAQAYGLASYAPHRAICFVSNVAAARSILDERAFVVPGIFLIGRYDLLGGEEAGVARCYETVMKARAKGARWAMIVEEKGHEDGIAFDVYAKLAEQCIAARYPAGADPSKGPVKLVELPEQSGWLGNLNTQGDDVARVAPFKDYAGDRAKASWLLNKDMALVYRSAATRNGPLVVGVTKLGRVYNPNTDPGTLFSIGGPVVDPGRKLQLVCDVRDLPDWSKIELFDGARKLGEVHAPAKPVLAVEVGGDQVVWCVHALAATKAGEVATSLPFYFTVRDPKIELRSATERAPKPACRDAIGPVGSKTALSVPVGYRPKAGAVAEDVLLAYGLTAAQEKTFAAEAGKVSAFWSLMGPGHDRIYMTPATHARIGSSFSIVTSMDARLCVKAAHSARGLYLYFEAKDNHFMASDPSPAGYGRTDALDVLLDPHASTWLNDPANVRQAVNPGWGLWLSTRQYIVAYGSNAPPKDMKRIVAYPWDMYFDVMTPLAELTARRGMQVRHVRINRVTRAQEWFIPWGELGVGGKTPAEPAVGSRLAFAPGYNDMDPGEPSEKDLRWIAKPSVKAAAAAAEAAQTGRPWRRTRTPVRTSPWAEAALGGEAPRGWGDIEIAPMID